MPLSYKLPSNSLHSAIFPQDLLHFLLLKQHHTSSMDSPVLVMSDSDEDLDFHYFGDFGHPDMAPEFGVFSDSDSEPYEDGIYDDDPFGFLPRLMYIFHHRQYQRRIHHALPTTVTGTKPEYNVHYSPNSQAKCQRCKFPILEGKCGKTAQEPYPDARSHSSFASVQVNCDSRMFSIMVCLASVQARSTHI